jgi:hypothetical protein
MKYDQLDQMPTFSLRALCRGAMHTGYGRIAQDVLAGRIGDVQSTRTVDDPEVIERTAATLSRPQLRAMMALSASTLNPTAEVSPDVAKHIAGLDDMDLNAGQEQLRQLVAGGSCAYPHVVLAKMAAEQGIESPQVDDEEGDDDENEEELDTSRLSKLVGGLDDDQLRSVLAMSTIVRHPIAALKPMGDDEQAALDAAIKSMSPEQRETLIGAAGSPRASVAARYLHAAAISNAAGRGLLPLPTVLPAQDVDDEDDEEEDDENEE